MLLCVVAVCAYNVDSLPRLSSRTNDFDGVIRIWGDDQMGHGDEALASKAFQKTTPKRPF